MCVCVIQDNIKTKVNFKIEKYYKYYVYYEGNIYIPHDNVILKIR